MEVSVDLFNGLVPRNTMILLKCDFNSFSISPDSPCKAFSAARDAADSLNTDSLWAAYLKYNYTVYHSVKACFWEESL